MKDVKDDALCSERRSDPPFLVAELLTLIEAFKAGRCGCIDPDPDPDCRHAKRWAEALSHAKALVKVHRAAKTAN